MAALPALDLAHASLLIEAIPFDDHLPAERSVMVFRTSVADPSCVDALRPLLNALVGRSGRWTFDLEDRDHVLRIEADTTDPEQVIRLVRKYGKECAELE